MESDYIPPPNNAVSFKSHLHQEVRQQQRDIKDARTRDLYAKIKMADRAKSYAKNVKEMYMPKIAQPKYTELPEYLPPVRGQSGNSNNHFVGSRGRFQNADNNELSELKPPMPINYRPNLEAAIGDDTSYRGSYLNTDSALTGGE
jgi:hypothetical protein